MNESMSGSENEPATKGDLNVMREPCATRPAAALSTSFGFGGMNAALVLRSAEGM